jgi:predicted peptidase
VRARRGWAPLFLLVFLTAACSTQSRFLERSVTVGEHQYRYRVWLPRHYTKVHRWPVLLYLHGSEERGDDNVRQLVSGIAPVLLRHGDWYRCIVVLPQCRPGQEWYGEMEQQALAAVQNTIREFRGDPRRTYVTGASMGGSGAWYMARHRRRFAAVVPVCGEIVRSPDDPFPTELPPDLARLLNAPDPYDAFAAAIDDTPVWIFHGADDPVVPVREARNMVAALRRHGARRVRYTELEGVGHNAWDHAYANATMVRWLLAQRLR